MKGLQAALGGCCTECCTLGGCVREDPPVELGSKSENSATLLVFRPSNHDNKDDFYAVSTRDLLAIRGIVLLLLLLSFFSRLAPLQARESDHQPWITTPTLRSS